MEPAPTVEHVPTVEAAPRVEHPTSAPEPAAGQTPAPEASEAPVAPEGPAEPVEPLPAGPNDPFVPPPHGEPNPLADNPRPGASPGPTPTGPNPATGEDISVAHPEPGYPGPSIVVSPGLLRIGGSGYAAGEMISVIFSVPNSDDNFLNHGPGARSEPVVVYADSNGSYTYDIQVAPELASGDYVVMTWAPNRGGDAAEASKRFLGVFVT
ncbi:hypothetical protein GCM10027404_08570 [Arthrobacter tumbae]